MDVRTTELDSGLVVVSERVTTVRSVAVGAWVVVGSRDEAADEHGCSHFLEHLLFKGTSRRTALDIAEEMDAVGGELNAFTARELTCFHARVLDEDLPLAVDLLGDMLTASNNDPADVDAERDVVLSEIDIHEDTPEDIVGRVLIEEVLGDHPLSRDALGTVDSVEAMPRDRIDAFYRRWYRPGAVVVAAAGNLDHDEMARLVQDHLADLGRGGGERPDRSVPPLARAASHGHVAKPTEQVHVTLGGRAPDLTDPRRPALAVFDVVLGGGPSSRLFQAVREERGLAYSTYSWTSSWTDAGMWGVYAGTNPRRHDELLAVLTEELDRFADSLTEAEVERAKGTLRGGVVLGGEDSGARMSRLGRWQTAGMPLLDTDELLARIERVQLDDVRELAAELLSGPRHTATVGPARVPAA